MYKILKRMIEQGNYESIADMRNKIDVFYAVTPPRLTEAEYRELNEMLNTKEQTQQPIV